MAARKGKGTKQGNIVFDSGFAQYRGNLPNMIVNNTVEKIWFKTPGSKAFLTLNVKTKKLHQHPSFKSLGYALRHRMLREAAQVMQTLSIV